MSAEKRRKRGRPPGPSTKGRETRERLYRVAIDLMARRGYEATTLRDIADEAGVSAGLLYRYFKSKRAVVLALYDDLSARYAERAAALPDGPWRERFLFALRTSLGVLGPHRGLLASLVPVLVSRSEEGLFAEGTSFSRERVMAVFAEAVAGAADAPAAALAGALGRVLYLLHLAVILGWLLDRSPEARATGRGLALLGGALSLAGPALWLPGVRRLIVEADALVGEAFF